MGHNELLIRDALKGRNRGQVVISVKCGALRDPDVILECGSAWIVLGHLQRGSVAVQAGQVMEPGHVLGRVGNRGNTGEPHLHVHAQRPGSTIAPLSGEPVPIRLGGRYLVRNDRVHSHREGS